MDEQNFSEDAGDEELSLDEMLGWAEFCAWSALVMTPIILWLQGPSVSADQFVVRTSLVVISALAGIGLRIRAVVARRREAGRSHKPQPNDRPSATPPESFSAPPQLAP